MQNIRTTCKRSVSICGVLLIGFLGLFPSFVQADTADFINHETGADSRNTNELTADNSVTVRENNTADIRNESRFILSTGNNSIEENTTVDDVTTGNIRVQEVVETTANTESSLNIPQSEEVTVRSINIQTGADSENNNITDSSSDITVERNNVAEINNRTDIIATTGNNSIVRNTRVGDITTGDIDVEVTYANVVNAESVSPTTPPSVVPTPTVPVSEVSPSPSPTPVSPAPINRAVITALETMAGVGGADVAMPERQFFPAGSNVLAYLLTLALALLGVSLGNRHTPIRKLTTRKKVAM